MLILPLAKIKRQLYPNQLNKQNSQQSQQRMSNGCMAKNLFKSNCAACHNPKADGTGPVLIGTIARWEKAGDFKEKTGKQWLYAWIRNWNEPVEAGYPYAKEMSAMRASVMNTFTQLSDADIEALLLYTEQPDLYKK
jgi:mono/diheme cytochrome c family protein